MPWLLYAQPYDTAISGLRSIYMSDVGFTSEPLDEPSNTYWTRRLETPLSIASSIYSGDAIGGFSDLDFGDIVLANDDGLLDELAFYDWDGRAVTVLFTPVERPRLSDFVVVFKGTAEQAVPGDQMRIEIRDLKALLDDPYQPNKFAGTGGIEGPEEYKDRRTPRAYGVLRQMEPVGLQPGYRISTVDTQRVGGFLVVQDKGVVLTAGPDYPDYPSLMSATDTGFNYVTCDALGKIRFMKDTFGAVTADVIGRTIDGDLMVNGQFASGAGSWTYGGGWSWSSGSMRHASGQVGALTQSVPTVPGKRYAVAAFITRTAGEVRLEVDGVALANATESGRRVAYFTATGTTAEVAFRCSTDFVGTVDAVTCYRFLANFAEIASAMIYGSPSQPMPTFIPGTVEASEIAAPQVLWDWYPGTVERTTRSAIDELSVSVGAWWGYDEIGRVEFGRFAAPAAVPDLILTTRDMDSITPRTVVRRLKSQIIAWGQRIRTLQAADLAVVPDDVKAAMTTEWRLETYKDAAVEAASLLSEESRQDTRIVEQAAAQAEAKRRVELSGPKRSMFDVETQFQPTLRKGMTVQLFDDRYGLAGGKSFVVVQLTRDAAANTHAIALWG